MTTHKIPLIGMIGGGVVSVCFIIRYFFLLYDPSQLIIGVIIGGLISILAYIYNWMKCQEQRNAEIDKRIDSFTKWMGVKELE